MLLLCFIWGVVVAVATPFWGRGFAEIFPCILGRGVFYIPTMKQPPPEASTRGHIY